VFPGSAGFALSSVLAGLFRLLLDPLRELFVSRRYRRGFEPRKRGLLGVFAPRWILSAVFLAAYGFICFFGHIPVLLGTTGIAVFFCLFLASLWAESSRGRDQGHIRFLPAPIMGPPVKPFPGMMVPFALASLGSLFLAPFFSVASPHAESGWPGNHLVGAADYERHLAFQRSFSYIPLGDDRAGFNDPSYLRYFTGEDGLIAGAVEYSGGQDQDIPPFPLKDLMEFLEYGDGYFYSYGMGDIIPVGIILLLPIPLLFQKVQGHRKKQKTLIYNDKRIAVSPGRVDGKYSRALSKL
jgi:hypothetical protein